MTAEKVIEAIKRRDYVSARDIVLALHAQVQAIGEAEPVLAHAYRTGDSTQRRFVGDGILEHLFESPDAVTRFEHWRGDSMRGGAYEEAQACAVPVLRKKRFLMKVAKLCLSEMENHVFLDPQVMDPEIGIDSVQLDWGDVEDRESLVLTCDDRTAETLSDDVSAQHNFARYALNQRHWSDDEYAPWQHVVVLDVDAATRLD